MGTSIIIGAAIGFAYLIAKSMKEDGYKKKCSKCNKWFALKLIHSELISTKKSQKVITTREETGEIELIQKRGKTIIKPRTRSTLKWVTAITYRYKNTTECKFCKDKFITFSEKQI